MYSFLTKTFFYVLRTHLCSSQRHVQKLVLLLPHQDLLLHQHLQQQLRSSQMHVYQLVLLCPHQELHLHRLDMHLLRNI
jgi:hypothetical protein